MKISPGKDAEQTKMYKSKKDFFHFFFLNIRISTLFNEKNETISASNENEKERRVKC